MIVEMKTFVVSCDNQQCETIPEVVQARSEQQAFERSGYHLSHIEDCGMTGYRMTQHVCPTCWGNNPELRK